MPKVKGASEKVVKKVRKTTKTETKDDYLVVDVHDMTGKVVGQETLNKDIFDKPASAQLLAQAIRVFTFNKRQGTVSVKDRSEVRGGGRKPWRQKGTGRARQGSIRSPQWRGGGVIHGPEMKDWSLRLSKKLRQKALLGALSLKARDKEIFLIADLTIKDGKTKDFVSTLAKLPLEVARRTLVVLPVKDDLVVRSARNLKNTQVQTVTNLNTLEVVTARNLLLTKEAVNQLESFLLRKVKLDNAAN